MDVALYQHWHDIYVKRWLIFLTAAVAAAIAWIASSMVQPVYEAKATFYLAANAAPATFSGSQPNAPQPPLLPFPEEKAASIDIGILRGTEMMNRLAEATSRHRTDLVRAIDVTVSNEFMVDLFVRDPNPAQAAAVANHVPDLYRRFHEEQMRLSAQTVTAALGNELASLEADRQALRTHMSTARTQSLSTADAVALAAAERERDAASEVAGALHRRHLDLSARIDSLDAALSAEASLYTEGRTTDTTSSLDVMLQRVLDLQVELASITATGPASPQRAAVEQEIAAIETAMENERERVRTAAAKPRGSLFEELRLERNKAAADLAGVVAQRPAATARLSDARERFASILAAMAETDADASRLSVLEGRIAATEQSVAASKLQADNVVAPVVLVSRALVPERPVFPLPVLNTVVAGLTGLIVGAYYALWLAHAERGIQARRTMRAELPYFTPEELEILMHGDPTALRESELLIQRTSSGETGA